MDNTTDSPRALSASDLFGFAHGGVWCCEHKAKCKWQGFALHQGLAWGEVPKLFPGYRDWRAVHDQECGGRLIQLVEPNDQRQATMIYTAGQASRLKALI